MSTAKHTQGRGGLVGLLIVVAITAAALIVGNQFVGSSGGQGASPGASSTVDVAGAQRRPAVGEQAPRLAAASLNGAFDLAEADKPTWVVFMASWCQQCRAEAPDVAAAAKARDDVEIVGVYLGEDEETVRAYNERLGLTFTAIPDESQKLAASYGVRAIPAHYFVDADGAVRELAFGALSADAIEEHLDRLVGG
ncbi:TlpA disulfide reductase family protein [uncultured Tessaracoccus sp.]|uniref:TlpA family protein disulfide reductase n=1 Tax=uncultured Tessaracoccus sp. TaxID=905023 RepID=UPI002624B89A|nr:TlpA disulfide reductase family protein [uncultured Tessaracoccus sp.]